MSIASLWKQRIQQFQTKSRKCYEHSRQDVWVTFKQSGVDIHRSPKQRKTMQKTAYCVRAALRSCRYLTTTTEGSSGRFTKTPTVLAKTLLVMKLTFVLLTAVFLNVSATSFSQQITFSGENVPLSAVFLSVKKQTGFVFLFGGPVLKSSKPVTISVENMSLKEFLDEVFKTQPIEYSITGKSIMVSLKSTEYTQFAESSPELFADSVPRFKITGSVVDFSGQPLTGATIRVKGKPSATTSNAQGVFEILAERGSTLVISYTGYAAVEEKVRSAKSLIIKLELNADLEEAVVYNGYQKIQQKYLTGSVTSLKMDSIIQPGLSSVDKMLEGRVPGMMFMQNSGQAGAAPKLRIRGTNTYLGSREPLWVVDGIVRTNPFPIDPQRLNDPDFVNLLGNAISGLNPFDIDQIDVLKDATAAALYGVRAANGVIVITTKRGKAGPPTLHYNVTNTLTKRPRYTDRAMHMMNAAERVDVSREMIDRQLQLRGGGLEAYETAMLQYYNGDIDFATFKNEVNKAETVNTDWLGHVMRDVFASNHTLSVSGGSNAASYRASIGFRPEPGVIKKEKSDVYTASLNTQLNYRKFQVDFNVQINRENKNYTPQEIGVLNYAYGTSRTIPLYNDDGSLYFYSTISSDPNTLVFNPVNRMNIVNELQNTGDNVRNSEYNAGLDLTYQIAKGLQFRTKLAYTGGSSVRETWFDEKTEWAFQLRSVAYNGTNGTYATNTDLMPFGGELRNQSVNRSNYLLNARLHFSRFLDKKKQHQLSADVATDVTSNSSNALSVTARGYYPNRGKSFAVIELQNYTRYRNWVKLDGRPIVTESLSKSIRPFVTSTYIYKDKFVLSGTASQEFSNSFGARSNEKFLPTWALSGRWNLHEDVFRNKLWVDNASLLVSMGVRGNMLPGQTIYTIMNKGALNTVHNEFASSIAYFPNPNLAWEKTKDYSATFIFSVLNGKMRGSLGYFFSRTTNAFMNMKVSAVNGAPSNNYVVNAGTLENQGVELSLNFKVIENVSANKKRFIWRFDPQLGQVFNKLLNRSLNSRNVLVDAAALTYKDFLNGTVPVNGKSVNTFYSYKYKTLDSQFGYPIFYGAEPENKVELANQYNKSSKEEMFSMVLVESGRREPVLQGGISNSFSYGNWNLQVNMAYSLGSNVRLLKIASGNYGTYRPSGQQNLRKEFVDRWRYPGDELHTNIPAIQGAGFVDMNHYAWWKINNTRLTNQFAENYYQMYDDADIRVVSGDYLKLQNVSFSYRLPKEFCSKWNCKGAILSIGGNNLFTLAHKSLRGQDPSQSGTAATLNLSIRPVYNFNINISF